MAQYIWQYLYHGLFSIKAIKGTMKIKLKLIIKNYIHIHIGSSKRSYVQ
jgi:hypothetical protein